MKRITFVFMGIMLITSSVFLTQNEKKDRDIKMVNTNFKQHHIKVIYD